MSGEVHDKALEAEAADCSVGVDTVRLAMVVTDPGASPLRSRRWREVVDEHTGEVWTSAPTSHGHLPGGQRLSLESYAGTKYAVVECSLPRSMQGHNVHPAAWPDAIRLMERLHAEVQELVPSIKTFSQTQLRRVDLVRDFHAPGAARHLEQLQHQVRCGRSAAAVFRTAKTGYINSMVIGTAGRWRVLVYDKFQEVLARKVARDVAPLAAGRWRYELQLRRPVLASRGVTTVDDLNEELLERLRREWFDKCRLGDPVLDQAAVAETLRRAVENNGTAAVPVVGQLLLESYGISVDRSDNTRKKYARLQRDMGLTGSMLRVGLTRTSRLDYTTGTLQGE